MKNIARSMCAATALALTPVTSAQATLVSTRTFNGDVFDVAGPSFASTGGQFMLNLGLEDLSLAHGQPSLVDIDLTVSWEFDIEVTNLSGETETYSYATPIDLISNPADCAPYANSFVSAFVPDVAAGASGRIVMQESRSYAFTNSTFDTACGNPWSWPDAWLWTSILDTVNRLARTGGAPIPANWIQVHVARATVNGSVEVTWEPNPLPHTTVCDGNATPTVVLEPRGDFQFEPSVWLFQSGAPNSTNLLVRADQATTVVPTTGICLQGSIQRIAGSLSTGGAPFRLPDVPSLIGTTEYFQSWFRTGPGTSATSECIEVQFL